VAADAPVPVAPIGSARATHRQARNPRSRFRDDDRLASHRPVAAPAAHHGGFEGPAPPVRSHVPSFADPRDKPEGIALARAGCAQHDATWVGQIKPDRACHFGHIGRPLEWVPADVKKTRTAKAVREPRGGAQTERGAHIDANHLPALRAPDWPWQASSTSHASCSCRLIHACSRQGQSRPSAQARLGRKGGHRRGRLGSIRARRPAESASGRGPRAVFCCSR
jgi:hypothetical protein